MKKNLIIFSIMLLMLSISAFADVEIQSNTTAGILVDRFTYTITLNETSTANLFVFDSAAETNLIYSNSPIINGTSHVFLVTGLTGETTYYFKVNGTAETPESAYDSTQLTVTTANYIVRGVARVLIGLLVLILMSTVLLFGVGNLGSISNKKLAAIFISWAIGTLILYNLTLGVLGL